MKINIALPLGLREKVDAAAKDIGVSRSRLVQAALDDFVRRRGGETFDEAVDRYVANRPPSGLAEEGETSLLPEPARQGRGTRQRLESKGPARRRTVISLSAGLIERVDAAAKHLGLTRDDLVCAGLADFLIRHHSSEVTRRLNRSHVKHPPEPDPLLDHLAVEAMKRTQWKE
jgi:metal-responsive CopG/Arc/MetJ family transcriptional regulator